MICECGEVVMAGQRLCRGCHAAYMRLYRSRKKLTGEARRRANARSYAHVYLKRGKIQRQPCEVCGDPAEMHHDDYSKPTEVRWLCRGHHHRLHEVARAASRVSIETINGWATKLLNKRKESPASVCEN